LIPKGTTDWKRFTSLVNVPIQGGCADAVKLAIIQLHRDLPDDTFIVGMLHDEVIIETNAEKALDILALAKGIMEDWGDVMFRDVPMLVEGKVHESWGTERVLIS
jgi:DNA polymerase I-like protein with 3'-5' exonuclease and polymerase domains